MAQANNSINRGLGLKRANIKASRQSQGQNAMREMNELLSHSLKKREVIEKTSIDASAIFEYARNSGIDLEFGQEFSVDYDDDDELEDEYDEDEYYGDDDIDDPARVNEHRVFYYVNPERQSDADEEWESEEAEDGAVSQENETSQNPSIKQENSESNSEQLKNQSEYDAMNLENNDDPVNEESVSRDSVSGKQVKNSLRNRDSESHSFEPSFDNEEKYSSSENNEFEDYNSFESPESSNYWDYLHDNGNDRDLMDMDDCLLDHSPGDEELSEDWSSQLHNTESSREWQTIREGSDIDQNVNNVDPANEEEPEEDYDENGNTEEEADMYYEWLGDDEQNSELYQEFIEDEGSIEYEEVFYPYHSSYRICNGLRAPSSRQRESEASVEAQPSHCHISDSFDSEHEGDQHSSESEGKCIGKMSPQPKENADDSEQDFVQNSETQRNESISTDSKQAKPPHD